jgi:hypothetical protein
MLLMSFVDMREDRQNNHNNNNCNTSLINNSYMSHNTSKEAKLKISVVMNKSKSSHSNSNEDNRKLIIGGGNVDNFRSASSVNQIRSNNALIFDLNSVGNNNQKRSAKQDETGYLTTLDSIFENEILNANFNDVNNFSVSHCNYSNDLGKNINSLF